MPVDYTRFDRLVAEDEEEDRRSEEARRRAEDERTRKEAEEQRRKELEALRRAEEQWRKDAGGHPGVVGPPSHAAPEVVADRGVDRNLMATTEVMAPDAGSALSAATDAEDVRAAAGRVSGLADPVSKASGMDLSAVGKEEIDMVEVDDFFRDRSQEEKEELRKRKEERLESKRLREEAAGRRPVRDQAMSPEQVQERINQLNASRCEMAALMERCDRPAVKARLGEFVVEMDNELARLREDPLELDDEDRRELRLFHLRKMQLPGAARTQKELFVEEGTCAPKALAAVSSEISREVPWQEITTFGFDPGEASTPVVTVDVRIEAVERLLEGAVSCQFTSDSFDLRVIHELQGRRYRLLRTCLLHDIVPERSAFRVKRNHIVITLAKEGAQQPKEELGEATSVGVQWYPLWAELCAADRRSRNPPTADSRFAGTDRSAHMKP